MKEILKDFLKKRGVYEYLRFSRSFSLYEHLFKPEVAKAAQREIALYKSFLTDCQLVFDIGANDGHKTAALLSISEKVVSVEPDPSNFRLLQIKFRNKKSRVSIENVAVSDHSGEAPLFIHRAGSAVNTINTRWKSILEGAEPGRWDEEITYAEKPILVKTVTLDDLISKYGKPDFVKIDTEGSDMQVLRGLSQPIKYISFEVLLPEYRLEAIEGLEHLSQLHNDTLFNLILEEKLLLPSFVPMKNLFEYIDEHLNNSFEIVARMGG